MPSTHMGNKHTIDGALSALRCTTKQLTFHNFYSLQTHPAAKFGGPIRQVIELTPSEPILIGNRPVVRPTPSGPPVQLVPDGLRLALLLQILTDAFLILIIVITITITVVAL